MRGCGCSLPAVRRLNLNIRCMSNNASLFSKSYSDIKRFSSMSFEKNTLLLSFTAIPVGNTSPHASLENERLSSANIGYRSISPVAVRGKRPAKRTKRLWASASARALVYSSNNSGSVTGKLAIAFFLCAAVPALTMSERP